MKIKTMIPVISLQLFAEGAAGAAASGCDGGTAQGAGVNAEAAAQQTKGVSNPLAEVKYGKQDASPAAGVNSESAVPDRNAEFEKLIKGEYKDLYDARMQDTIRKRLKGPMETVDKFNALSPTLELLARKYGVDASDINALNKAIEADDTYFEEEALQRGISVKQLKQIRAMERENAELRRQMQEQERTENANRLYASWMQQAEDARKVYPGFDLKAEMDNPRFLELLRSNIDVRTAYEVLHKDEIIPAAMQFAAQTVEKKISNRIIANGARPMENGMRSQASAVVKSDVSQLSRADRDEIRRRVARGEKISF